MNTKTDPEILKTSLVPDLCGENPMSTSIETTFRFLLKRDSKQMVKLLIENMKFKLNGEPLVFAEHGVKLITSNKTSQTAVLEYVDAVASMSVLTRKAGTVFYVTDDVKPILQDRSKICQPCEVFHVDRIF